MWRHAKNAVQFETAILCKYRAALTGEADRLVAPSKAVEHSVWAVIGRVSGGAPFLLSLMGTRGLDSEAAWQWEDELSPYQKGMILHVLSRKVGLGNVLGFLQVHDLGDVLSVAQALAAKKQARDLIVAFTRDVWHAKYFLHGYVTLDVPFDEKDEAKALGAKWDSLSHVWKVNPQRDMAAFDRWMPGADLYADYVTLDVPFVEKAQARALGALWDGMARTWRVKRQEDMSPFERWIGRASDREADGAPLDAAYVTLAVPFAEKDQAKSLGI